MWSSELSFFLAGVGTEDDNGGPRPLLPGPALSPTPIKFHGFRGLRGEGVVESVGRKTLEER